MLALSDPRFSSYISYRERGPGQMVGEGGSEHPWARGTYNFIPCSQFAWLAWHQNSPADSGRVVISASRLASAAE